jgi:glycosyltransferase involved in cell wall biosynthesis
MAGGLAVIETHPVQYHAPVFRQVEQEYGLPVTAIYGSDFSVSGYRDQEFGVDIAWDTDLLSGYRQRFLARVASGGARTLGEVSARGLFNALKEVQPAAVMLQGYSPAFNRAAIRAGLRLGRPLLFRAETTDHARARGPVLALTRRVVLSLMYRSFDRLLYIGTRSREHYERLGVTPERLVFSPYCVDTTSFQTGEEERDALRTKGRMELHIPTGRHVLLFSGKLTARKGGHLIVEAVRRLSPSDRSNTTIVFLGDGDQRQFLKAASEDRPAVDIRIVGFRNQTELSRYFHAADALVLPSCYAETWGLVVNEALHHGLPCVISEAVGCLPDLLTPSVTGEICQTADVESLGEAIRRVRRLRDSRLVRDQCRARASQFSLGRAAAGIRDAFASVVTSA